MYISVSNSTFHYSFNIVRPDNFSYQGLDVLYEYLTSSEDDERTIELDVIALCCEYAEDSNENHIANYDLDSMEELDNSTIVIKVDDETSIIQDF